MTAYIGITYLTSSGVWVGGRGLPARTGRMLETRLNDMAALTALIEPEAKALGLDLVRVAMFGGEDGPVLQVMAERPDTRQLTLADCGALSRRVSEVFDEVDPIEEAYRLEVSSPGIDRPLTRIADYADWAGHRAKLKLSEALDGQKQFDGELAGVEGSNILIDLETPIRSSRAKSRDLAPQEGASTSLGTNGSVVIPFAQIATGKLVLTDKLIAATAPLDAGEAEELEEEDDE